MPLADVRRAIAGNLQRLGQRDLRGLEVVLALRQQHAARSAARSPEENMPFGCGGWCPVALVMPCRAEYCPSGAIARVGEQSGCA